MDAFNIWHSEWCFEVQRFKHSETTISFTPRCDRSKSIKARYDANCVQHLGLRAALRSKRSEGSRLYRKVMLGRQETKGWGSGLHRKILRALGLQPPLLSWDLVICIVQYISALCVVILFIINSYFISILVQVILECEKHAKLVICVYLSVLCDIMLRALLSSLVNSIPLHNALFHAQPDKVWEESWSPRYLLFRFASMLTSDPPRRRITPILFCPTSSFPDTSLPQPHYKMAIGTFSIFSHFYHINGIIPSEAAFQVCLKEKHIQSTSVR